MVWYNSYDCISLRILVPYVTYLNERISIPSSSTASYNCATEKLLTYLRECNLFVVRKPPCVYWVEFYQWRGCWSHLSFRIQSTETVISSLMRAEMVRLPESCPNIHFDLYSLRYTVWATPADREKPRAQLPYCTGWIARQNNAAW